MISVIIPMHFEDRKYLNRCLDSIDEAKKHCCEDIEVLVIPNDDGIGKARNSGAKIAKGETLVFMDVDCTMSDTFLYEVNKISKNDYFVGGGTKWVKGNRYSLGLLFFYIVLGIYLIVKQITVGAFWIKKDIFDIIGGFREDCDTTEQIDFAIRLKQYAKKHSKKFESIKRSYIIWNTRNFSIHGDWHWLRGYKTAT